MASRYRRTLSYQIQGIDQIISPPHLEKLYRLPENHIELIADLPSWWSIISYLWASYMMLWAKTWRPNLSWSTCEPTGCSQLYQPTWKPTIESFIKETCDEISYAIKKMVKQQIGHCFQFQRKQHICVWQEIIRLNK